LEAEFRQLTEAFHFEYELHLIGMRFAWKQGFAADEFSHDAADGPEVNGLAIRAIGRQQ
jgi:hypothetical protein